MTTDATGADGPPAPAPTTYRGPWWGAYATGAFAGAVFLLWWTAYYPGISTVDSMQTWDQAKAWVFQDWHPVFYTWLVALLTRIWFSPAVVTLLQITALAVVLASLTRRFQRLGLVPWLAVGLPCVVALSPQTGFTSVVMWKDIPFAVSVLWTFSEVLGVVAEPERVFASRWRCARLGLAVLAVVLFRQNGIAVGGLVVVGVVVAFRKWWAELALPVVIVAGGYAVVNGPLYTYLDAWPTPALFSYTTFLHDMGAFVTYHADELKPDERAFLEQILPIDRWRAPDKVTNPKGLYYCRQATPLIFASEFYAGQRLDRDGRLVPSASLPPVLRQNPESVFLEQHKGEFRSLWMRFVRRWPGTFLGHRFCVGSVAWSPWHKTGLEVFEPPRQSTVRTPELQVRPLSGPLNRFSGKVLRVWDRNERRWITWRAATWIYCSFVVGALAAWRRRDGRVLVVVLPGLAAWLSVLTFNPGQSARYLYPAYLCALSSLALLGLSRRTTSPPADDVVGAPVDELQEPVVSVASDPSG